MTELFSDEGFVKKQKTIKDLAEGLGFSIDQDRLFDVVFIAFRSRAKKIIMVVSGTHGVEGPAGYDLQLKLLEDRVHEKLPADTGLVFVVALNPWGWVNGRRTDKNNVDLNRNGWYGAPPVLPPLDPEINALVNPEKCDEQWYQELTAWLADPAKTARLRTQVFRGQYDNPKGIFYGGKKRARSLVQLQEYCKNFASTCQHLAVLDIHTGLGEWSEITLLSPTDDGVDRENLKSWFGLGVQFPNRANTVTDDLLDFFTSVLPGNMDLTGLTVEIGTIPFEESFPILVMENLLHHQPTATFEFPSMGTMWPTTQEGVRRRFSQIFYPPVGCDSEWSALARAGFMPIFRTVVRGLAEL